MSGRKYKAGEVLRYEMTGSNRGWEYTVQAEAVVKQDDTGVFYEQIGWSNLRSNAPMTLSPISLSFRQNLSIAGTDKYLVVPDLSKVQPFLIGPITDMLTIYSDVFIAGQMKLVREGQHAYFAHGTPSSWADGQRVVEGEDSIDFDMTLLEVKPADHTATLLVRHVAPEHPQVQLSAPWMKAPVANGANNWVQVEKTGTGYTAQVGSEMFEVKIVLDTRDGSIVLAKLHNPVVAISRDCVDTALTQCSVTTPETIVREVSLRQLP